MMQSDTRVPAVQCPKCSRQYRWSAKLAGKRVRCKCSHVLEIPASPHEAEPAEPAGAGETNSGIKPPPAWMGASMSPMEKALANGEFAYQGSRWRDRYAPIGALSVGVVITVVIWINHVDSIGAGLARAGLVVLIQAVLGVPVAVAAAAGTTQLLDASFGATRDAVAKLAAVAVGLGGLADSLLFMLITTVHFDIWHVLVGVVLYIILCGGPLAFIFRLDRNESILLGGLLAVPRVVAVLLSIPFFKDELFPAVL